MIPAFIITVYANGKPYAVRAANTLADAEAAFRRLREACPGRVVVVERTDAFEVAQ